MEAKNRKCINHRICPHTLNGMQHSPTEERTKEKCQKERALAEINSLLLLSSVRCVLFLLIIVLIFVAS